LRRPFIIALLLLAGCSQILGLEDRKLILDGGLDGGQDGGSDSGATPGCAEYCSAATDLCTKDAGLQLFQTPDTCLAVCAKYSTDPSVSGDTLACRLQQLRGLRGAGSNEAATACPPASPGGGPAPSEPNTLACGSNCEGFCALRAKVCPVMAGDIDCVRKCSALVDDTPYNADADFGSGSDTLSCRLAHLSAATYYGSQQGMEATRDAHCAHSGIRSETQCDFKDDKDIDCKSYCKLVGVACTGDSAIFESQQQCEGFCTKLESGGSKDITKLATRRCLRNGAYDALERGPQLCPAAAITGDNCQGGRCAAYCQLARMKEGCQAEFEARYGTSDPLGACQANCAQLDGILSNTPYSITLDQAKRGKDLRCRLLHLARVLGEGKGATECANALGLPGSECN
jgi:hypothetical protein